MSDFESNVRDFESKMISYTIYRQVKFEEGRDRYCVCYADGRCVEMELVNEADGELGPISEQKA